MKSPVIATMLNLIPGLGYVYIGGKRRILGLALLISSALSTYQQVFEEAVLTSRDLSPTWLSFLASLIMIIAFMYDAYHYCLEFNAKRDQELKNLLKKA